MSRDGWFFTWTNLWANLGSFVITGLMLLLIASAASADVPVFTEQVPVYSLTNGVWKMKVSRVQAAPQSRPYVCFQYDTKKPVATCWYTFPDGTTVTAPQRLVGEFVT